MQHRSARAPVESEKESLDANTVGENEFQVASAHPTCSDATEQHCTGKERDTESGLDYFGARYYASTLRIMSRPTIFPTGEASVGLGAVKIKCVANDHWRYIDFRD